MAAQDHDTSFLLTYACRRRWHDRCDGLITWIKPAGTCQCACHPVVKQAGLWDEPDGAVA